MLNPRKDFGGAVPPRIEGIRLIGVGRIRLGLTDGTFRVTLAIVCDRGLRTGTAWRPEWDRSPLVLREPLSHERDLPETPLP